MEKTLNKDEVVDKSGIEFTRKIPKLPSDTEMLLNVINSKNSEVIDSADIDIDSDIIDDNNGSNSDVIDTISDIIDSNIEISFNFIDSTNMSDNDNSNDIKNKKNDSLKTLGTRKGNKLTNFNIDHATISSILSNTNSIYI